MKEKLLLVCGFLLIILAIIGIILPLLPTTPFLILAAACFYKSSPQMHHWIIHHPIFGEPIRKFQENRIITVKTKILSLSMLWIFILYSALFVVSFVAIKILLIFIAFLVSLYILSFKSL